MFHTLQKVGGEKNIHLRHTFLTSASDAAPISIPLQKNDLKFDLVLSSAQGLYCLHNVMDEVWKEFGRIPIHKF